MRDFIKKYDEKGFTLMEMLIVVAIIAILVAIAFPIFSKQLNSARVATDAANIRTGYASATLKVLEDGDDALESNNYLQKNGDLAASTTDKVYKTQGKAEDGDSVVANLSSCGISHGWGKNETISYSVNNGIVEAKIGNE